ncbi:MAG: hypothetical protein LBM93_03830 [Oscillospiraceae bacterium]|jgi:hypothetical protein|nr:hypothetical protein [Oscillospiraceae bacterium]
MDILSELKTFLEVDNFNILEEENRLTANATITGNMLNKENFTDNIIDILNNVPDRDHFIIRFAYATDVDFKLEIWKTQNLILDSEQLNVSSFIEDNSINNTDEIEVNIRVNKNIINNKFTIFDFNSFRSWLLSMSLQQTMSWFSKQFTETRGSSLTFECLGCDYVSFATKTLMFTNSIDSDFEIDFSRSEKIDICKENTIFHNMQEYELLPEDFKIISGNVDITIKDTFSKISCLLSLAYISTYSRIDNSSIEGKIVGERTKNYNYNISAFTDNKNLFRLYEWSYSDNISDKLQISRNILSLMCNFDNINQIDKHIFEVIKSHYRFYLKDNLKEYLQLKRDMSEFISNTFVQISEYSMSVLNAFKTNLLALGGYLFGLVLTVISGGIDILDIFSDTIMKLTIIVLCSSVIYLLISKSEAQHKLNDVQDGYEAMKKSYKDILSEDEIKTLTEDDGESILDKFKIKAQKGMRNWTIIGIGFMIVGISFCSLKLFAF